MPINRSCQQRIHNRIVFYVQLKQPVVSQLNQPLHRRHQKQSCRQLWASWAQACLVKMQSLTRTTTTKPGWITFRFLYIDCRCVVEFFNAGMKAFAWFACRIQSQILQNIFSVLCAEYIVSLCHSPRRSSPLSSFVASQAVASLDWAERVSWSWAGEIVGFIQETSFDGVLYYLHVLEGERILRRYHSSDSMPCHSHCRYTI